MTHLAHSCHPAEYYEYDAFKHLQHSLSLDENALMPMFTVYLDESGTHGESPVIVVGGYIATVKRWIEFERTWKTFIMEREGIKVLHRVDVENFADEFKNWSRARQIKVLRRAHKIIKRYTCIGFSQSVVLADFEKLIPDEVRRAFGGAYGWAALDCLVHVAKWADVHGYRDPIQYVFEKGAEGRHQVDRMFSVLTEPPLGSQPSVLLLDKLRVAGWSFAGKESICALQAADFYAYETYKHMENRIVDGIKRPVRKSALDLIRTTDLQFWSGEKQLQQWIHDQEQIIRKLKDRESFLKSIGRANLI